MLYGPALSIPGIQNTQLPISEAAYNAEEVEEKFQISF